MCTNPINVNVAKNTRYYYKGYSSVGSIKAPCGRCLECLNLHQTDYFIRSHAEFDECVKNGGSVAFITLTYSNNCVPLFHYFYDSVDNQINLYPITYYIADTQNLPYIYSFGKENVQTFLNSLRKHYERIDKRFKFRYFIAPEYGSNEIYTMRPHYHGLIFLNKELTEYYNNHSQTRIYPPSDILLDDVKRYWKHGNVSASEHGLFIDSYKAIKYCSKYIAKTYSLTNNKFFVGLYNTILGHFDELKETYFNVVENCNDCSNITPFHIFNKILKDCGSNFFVLKSRNFGANAISEISNYIDNGDYDKALELYNQGYKYIDISNGKTEYVPYSNYYLKKLFYSTRSDGSYHLNDVGYYAKINFTEKVINKTIDDVKHFISSNSYYDLTTNISKDDYEYFCNVLSEQNALTAFTIYYRLVRGRVFPSLISGALHNYFSHYFKYNNTLSNILQQLYKLNFGHYSIKDIEKVRPLDFNTLNMAQFKDKYYFSESFIHVDFEYLYNIYITIRNYNYSKLYQANKEKYDKIKHLSDRLNKDKYKK